MGEHAPDCTLKIRTGFDCQGFCWRIWTGTFTECAIGQPAPQEETFAWESRVLVLGEQLDGRILPTRVRQ